MGQLTDGDRTTSGGELFHTYIHVIFVHNMLYYVLLRVIFGRIKKEHDTDFIQIFMHDSAVENSRLRPRVRNSKTQTHT